MLGFKHNTLNTFWSSCACIIPLLVSYTQILRLNVWLKIWTVISHKTTGKIEIGFIGKDKQNATIKVYLLTCSHDQTKKDFFPYFSEHTGLISQKYWVTRFGMYGTNLYFTLLFLKSHSLRSWNTFFGKFWKCYRCSGVHLCVHLQETFFWPYLTSLAFWVKSDELYLFRKNVRIKFYMIYFFNSLQLWPKLEKIGQVKVYCCHRIFDLKKSMQDSRTRGSTHPANIS